MNEEELETRGLLQKSDDKITIEEAVFKTGNRGLGIFQISALLILCCSTSAQTLIYNSFALFTHLPVIKCYTFDGSVVPCTVDDYCHQNQTSPRYSGYEIDWSKEDNDGTIKNWVTDYDLMCDDTGFLDLVTALYFGGTVISALVVNWCAEVWGRKPVLAVSIFIQTLSFLFTLLGPYIDRSVLGVALFFMGTTFSAQWQVATVYLLEITSAEYKTTFSNVLQLASHLWFLLLLLFIYLTKDCLTMVWITTGICFVLLFLETFFFCESPRYLLARSRLNETFRSLEYMMKVNREPVVRLNLRAEELKIGVLSSSISHSSEPRVAGPSRFNTFTELVSSRKAFTATTIMVLIWGCSNFLYYGVAVNADQLRGSVFTVLLIVGVAITIGTLIVLFCADLVKRRVFLGVSSLILTLSFLIYFVFGAYSSILTEILLLIAIACVGIIFTLIYVITAEVFPTYVRSTGFGVTNVIGKLFAFTVPFLTRVMGENTVILYIVAGALNFFLTFLLEETRGQPLREDWEIEPLFQSEEENV